jgi:hypothetical protein
LPPLSTCAPTAPTPSFSKGIKSEIFEQGSSLIRIHHRDNKPIWFGPKTGAAPAYRFDAPNGQYRVLYAAAALDGAFVETILHGRTKNRIIALSYVEARAWTELITQRPLRLMKLYDEGLFWHGTDASISAVDSYVEPRRIALTAFEEDADLDGVVYRARHDNGELCFALFDRVQATDLDPGNPELFADHPAELDGLVAKYGAMLDRNPTIPPP